VYIKTHVFVARKPVAFVELSEKRSGSLVMGHSRNKLSLRYLKTSTNRLWLRLSGGQIKVGFLAATYVSFFTHVYFT